MTTPVFPSKFVMLGTLAEQPKLSPTSQLPVCDAKLKTLRKNKQGEITETFPLTLWGELANRICTESPGSVIYAEGILQRKERTSKAGGTYFTTEIVATNYVVLCPKVTAPPVEEEWHPQPVKQPAPKQQGFKNIDDIPF